MIYYLCEAKYDTKLMGFGSDGYVDVFVTKNVEGTWCWNRDVAGWRSLISMRAVIRRSNSRIATDEEVTAILLMAG